MCIIYTIKIDISLIHFKNFLIVIYHDFVIFPFLFLAFTGFETNNKYEIKNSMGQRVYFAAEGNVFLQLNQCKLGHCFWVHFG